MVVGIYSVPDAVYPKRRCSDGSSGLLPCGRANKRSKSETEVILEAPEAQEPSSSVVLLEENGGIWHVDGLLELLAGALCATFGADPASLDLNGGPDGEVLLTTGCSCPSATDADENKANTSTPLQDQADQKSDQQQPQQQLPQRPSLTALTELNLRVHTASAQPAAGAGPRTPSPDNDDDRASVASLSAWVGGMTSPRRRGSEGGTQQQQQQQGLASGVAQLALGAPSAFSFPRRSSCGGGGGGCLGSDAAAAATDGSEPRWPRRRLPSAARW
ncbi:hypothetical protein PLESTB_001127500 [Pleodorina starrii]|uniref:Uncharacterized protein n=1 Tax=Pleodorina starrii TaxID=330485 RepID=A0A9W6BRH8_9CHLO|nr:hypothetical protein PLESTM_001365100 [Pleodorina starrii]GLC56620.1 hypothetical protein PLESTB_001127500 [Pleodorina starrii]GLC76208.1 hypothetical protein PLESTF_001749700 [Pleodorina starrii]